MKWYYLAILIWILEILMFISIIFIPAVMYLRDYHWWFNSPFLIAKIRINKRCINNEDIENESNND